VQGQTQEVLTQVHLCEHYTTGALAPLGTQHAVTVGNREQRNRLR
jgi:hypothetical protein